MLTSVRRSWLLFGCTVFFAALLLGGAFSPAHAQTEVAFWHALGSDHQAVLNDLTAQFNEANPDVVVVPEYIGNYGALQQKLIASVAAQRPPAISLVYNNWTAAFVDADAVTPVDQFIDDAQHGLSAEEAADYVAAFVEANTWDGVWTTIPFNKSIYVLYYNEDLLSEADAAVPATMDELRDAATKVTASTHAKGLALQANVDQFGIFLHAFGGSWIGEDGQVAFNNEAGVAALEFMQQLVLEDDAAYYHDGYLDDEFNQGSTAMFFATVATIPWLSSDLHQWGAAPVPADVVQAAVVQGTDLAIFSGVSEAEQMAAWRFARWITSPDVNAQWAEKTGYLPVRQSAADGEAYQAHVASAPEKYEAGIAQLATAKFDPGVTAWATARETITYAVQRALIEGVSAEVALNEAAAAINKELAN